MVLPDLLKRAENLWGSLQNNDLGGYSGINRPFWIVSVFREIIEEFGNRDTGYTWSQDDLKKAREAGVVDSTPPVDTINIKREVLQGARAALAIILKTHDMTCKGKECQISGIDIGRVSLASLDAVLEGE